MTTITIPKKEYKELVETKLRYEYVRRALEDGIFSPPPTHSAREVARAFEKTEKYSRKFLGSLEKGLKRSTHF